MRMTPQALKEVLLEELDANYPYSVVPIFTAEYSLYNIVIEKGNGSFASIWLCSARHYEDALRHMTWQIHMPKVLITVSDAYLDEVLYSTIESTCLELGFEYISLHPTNLQCLNNELEKSLTIRL